MHFYVQVWSAECIKESVHLLKYVSIGRPRPMYTWHMIVNQVWLYLFKYFSSLLTRSGLLLLASSTHHATIWWRPLACFCLTQHGQDICSLTVPWQDTRRTGCVLFRRTGCVLFRRTGCVLFSVEGLIVKPRLDWMFCLTTYSNWIDAPVCLV